MGNRDKYALGYEVDQLAKASPIMKFIDEKMTEGTLTELEAAEFYRVEWDRCVERVAKQHGLTDLDVVWDSFNDYNDD